MYPENFLFVKNCSAKNFFGISSSFWNYSERMKTISSENIFAKWFPEFLSTFCFEIAFVSLYEIVRFFLVSLLKMTQTNQSRFVLWKLLFCFDKTVKEFANKPVNIARGNKYRSTNLNDSNRREKEFKNQLITRNPLQKCSEIRKEKTRVCRVLHKINITWR